MRTWDHLKEEWRLTKLGEEFFSQQKDRWIARVPVKVYLRRANGSYYVKEGWLESTSVPSLGELTFPASMSEVDQRAEVKRQVDAWLDSQTEEKPLFSHRSPMLSRGGITGTMVSSSGSLRNGKSILTV